MENNLTIVQKEFYNAIKPMWVTQSGMDESVFQKEVSFAIQHAIKNPYLQKCEPNSVLRAVMNIAQVGLTLNPVSKYAYLIPRYNGQNKQMECVLEPSYIGLSKLLTDSGSVNSIECHLIYEGDAIKVDMASDQKILSHVPYFLNSKPKGGILGVYSNATLSDGTKHVELMSFVELHEIRDRSESYKAYVAKKITSCTWVSDEGEMCRKTIIKRHSKYLPKSDKTAKFDQAVDLDNQVNGFREQMDFGMLSFLETSINNSTLNPDRQTKLLAEIGKMQFKDEAYKLIDELQQAQPIMGRDLTPHTISDQKKAIQYSVDKDDFHEWKKEQKK